MPDLKLSEIPETTSPTPSDTIVGVDSSGSFDFRNTYQNAAKAIGQVLYPIGSIYVNKTSSTNPATLFGFGTWVALEGRVVVGKSATGTFNTAGATGGEETHTLTITEMPAHIHTMKAVSDGANNTSPDGRRLAATADGTYRAPSGTTEVNMGSNVTSTGGGAAHNNLQPYVVAYMWERTA